MYFVVLNVTLTLFLASVLDRKNRIVYEIFTLILIFFFVGFSYKNGWDLNEYIRFFNLASQGTVGVDYLNSTLFIEKGFGYLNYLVSKLNLGFEGFVLVFGLFTSLIYFHTTRSLRVNFALFMALFLCASFTRLELSTLRQGLAVALFFLSIVFIHKRQFVIFVLLILLAAQFHRTAYVLILIYPLLIKNYNRKVYWLIALFSLPILIINSYSKISLEIVDFIESLSFLRGFDGLLYKIRFYLALDASVLSPQRLLLLLFYILTLRFFKPRNMRETIAFNLFSLHIILNFFFSFFSTVILLRFEYYLQFGWMLVFCYFLSDRITNKYNFRVLAACMIVFCNVKMLLLFKHESERAVYFPYMNVLYYHIAYDNKEYKGFEYTNKYADMLNK
ncbi:EpsG family protein [Vibrio breoganii]